MTWAWTDLGGTIIDRPAFEPETRMLLVRGTDNRLAWRIVDAGPGWQLLDAGRLRVSQAPGLCRVIGDVMALVVVQQERSPPIQQILHAPYEGAQPRDGLELRELAGFTCDAPALAQSWVYPVGWQDLVVRGGDNAYYHVRGSDQLHTAQWQAIPNGAFSSAPSVAHRGPAFVRDAGADDGGTGLYRSRLYLEVVGRGLNNLVYHASRLAEEAWSGWEPIAGLATQFAPAIVSLAKDELHSFAVGLDGRMYVSAWAGRGGWGRWTMVEGSPLCTSGPTLGRTGEREVSLFVRGETGSVVRGVATLPVPARLPSGPRLQP